MHNIDMQPRKNQILGNTSFLRSWYMMFTLMLLKWFGFKYVLEVAYLKQTTEGEDIYGSWRRIQRYVYFGDATSSLKFAISGTNGKVVARIVNVVTANSVVTMSEDPLDTDLIWCTIGSAPIATLHPIDDF